MLESRPPSSRSSSAASPFRAYSSNSPQAKARLIALALLADGRLDDRELNELARRDAFAALGLSRDEFFEVLYDFCADMATVPNRDEHYLLSPEILADMLAEITDSVERKALLRLIFDVIRSDGRLAVGEARLCWNTVDAWQMDWNGRGRNLHIRKHRRRVSALECTSEAHRAIDH